MNSKKKKEELRRQSGNQHDSTATRKQGTSEPHNQANHVYFLIDPPVAVYIMSQILLSSVSRRLCMLYHVDDCISLDQRNSEDK